MRLDPGVNFAKASQEHTMHPVVATSPLAPIAQAGMALCHHHSAAEGYFHAEYPAASIAGVGAGIPVLYEGHRIGVVVRTEPEEASLRVVFKVDPRLSGLVAASPAYVDEMGGRRYLRIGPPPPLRGFPGSR